MACNFSIEFAVRPTQIKTTSLVSIIKTSPLLKNSHEIAGIWRNIGVLRPFTRNNLGSKVSVTWFNPEATPPLNNLKDQLYIIHCRILFKWWHIITYKLKHKWDNKIVQTYARK